MALKAVELVFYLRRLTLLLLLLVHLCWFFTPSMPVLLITVVLSSVETAARSC